MFEKEAEEYRKDFNYYQDWHGQVIDKSPSTIVEESFKDGAETTLRKVIKHFSTLVLDENCGGYFSYLLESEEKLQELAKELENV